MSIIWRVLYFGWVAGEIVIAIGTRRRSHAEENQDRGTQVLLWLVIVLSLTAAGFLEALVPASFRWHAAWLRPLSLILMIFGIAVRAAAIATLGRWFTANVVTQPEQQLQQGGLYSLVRHPSYLGMEIIFVAIGLHSRAWPALIVAVVLTCAPETGPRFGRISEQGERDEEGTIQRRADHRHFEAA